MRDCCFQSAITLQPLERPLVAESRLSLGLRQNDGY